jgi:hypothetical protein
VAEILGKVTAPTPGDVPRGADVVLRVAVPPSWFDEAQSIEVELPRNLVCARCMGGGCGKCHQSGAITLRGRSELPEFVQVVLPQRRYADPSQSMRLSDEGAPNSERAPDSQPTSVRPVTIRIPECGGLPDTTAGELTRGWLLLEVSFAEFPSANVRCLSDLDDPVSSANMLRAEVRRSSSRAAPDDAPESRIARAGSTVPPTIAARRKSAPSIDPFHAKAAPTSVRPRKAAIIAWGTAVLLAASAIAAWALL